MNSGWWAVFAMIGMATTLIIVLSLIANLFMVWIDGIKGGRMKALERWLADERAENSKLRAQNKTLQESVIREIAKE